MRDRDPVDPELRAGPRMTGPPPDPDVARAVAPTVGLQLASGTPSTSDSRRISLKAVVLGALTDIGGSLLAMTAIGLIVNILLSGQDVPPEELERQLQRPGFMVPSLLLGLAFTMLGVSSRAGSPEGPRRSTEPSSAPFASSSACCSGRSLLQSRRGMRPYLYWAPFHWDCWGAIWRRSPGTSASSEPHILLVAGHPDRRRGSTSPRAGDPGSRAGPLARAGPSGCSPGSPSGSGGAARTFTSKSGDGRGS